MNTRNNETLRCVLLYLLFSLNAATRSSTTVCTWYQVLLLITTTTNEKSPTDRETLTNGNKKKEKKMREKKRESFVLVEYFLFFLLFVRKNNKASSFVICYANSSSMRNYANVPSFILIQLESCFTRCKDHMSLDRILLPLSIHSETRVSLPPKHNSSLKFYHHLFEL